MKKNINTSDHDINKEEESIVSTATLETSYVLIKDEDDTDVSKNEVKELGNIATYKPRSKYLGLFQMPPEQSIWLKSSTFTFNSLLFATQIALNAKMLSMLGADGNGAGSIVSTFQNITIGTAVSCMLSTGIEMSSPMATRDFEKAGDVVKASWALTGALSALNVVILLNSRWAFPLLFEEKSAKMASDYFTGYAAGSIPGLFMTTNLQVAVQTGDLDISTLTVLSSTIPGVLLSYALAFPANLGALGLGIGASAPNFLSACFIHLWFLKGRYAEFKFYKLPLTELKKNSDALMKTGIQLAFQRLTEWGNLFAITLLLGKVAPSSAVSALHPAIQYSAIVAFSLQGLAHVSTMLIKKEKTSFQNNVDAANFDNAAHNYYKIIRTLVTNNAAGTFAAGVIFLPFYFAREPLCDFFLSDETDQETRELAQRFLWISMLGLIPDAPRIVSLGVLRSWNEVFWPTLICLIVMSVVAIPAGYGASELDDDWSYILIIRNIAMAISAVMLGERCANQMLKDREKIKAHLEATPFMSSSSSSTKTTSCCPGFNKSIIKDIKAAFQDSSEQVENDDKQGLLFK
ncbi:MAG: MATE family efflux transporter [Taibaiella sp.]|jgi:Na+-driven multidrug efflux pump